MFIKLSVDMAEKLRPERITTSFKYRIRVLTTMGRIKTQLSKRVTQELMQKHGDAFSTDFEENKKLVKDYTTVSSRRIKNTVAGYVTRLKRQK